MKQVRWLGNHLRRGGRLMHDERLTVVDRVIAHMDLDAFFAAVEQLLNPRLAGKPVVVGGAAHQRGVVASASYEARARGVYVPMPLTRAYRVCPEAHFVPGRHDAYGEYSARVFEVCERTAPQIEKASIDEAYLDWRVEQWVADHPACTPPVHWPLSLAENLRCAVLDEVGLSVSVGVGSNRLIAKIASKYAKPRGICHVAKGAECAFLRPLRLNVIPGVGRRAAEMLEAVSLRTFADVQDLPVSALEASVGDGWAKRLTRWARGEGRSDLVLPGAPKSVSNEHTFERDCQDMQEVDRTLYRLVEKAAWRLRRTGLKTGVCTVKLRTADFHTRTHSRTLPCHTDCHQELYAVARGLLLDLTRRPASIRLVGVNFSNLHMVSERQMLLYEEDQRETARRVDHTLDLVRERFGFKTITTARSL